MKKMDLSGFGITENIWLGSILALSFVVITFTVWCLSHGITTIFPNLYYILIVIIAYHYRKTGFYLVLLLSLAYLTLVILFTHGDTSSLTDAAERAIVFIIIGALIAYISETLSTSLDTIHDKFQIQQSIIQNANVLLVVLDPRGRILEWNKAAEEMSGYTAQEVVGQNLIWKSLYPDTMYRKTITSTITRVIGANQFFENFETVIRTKSGGQKTISWNTRAIPGEQGRPSGFVAIGIDVTARKNLESQLSLQNAQMSLAQRMAKIGYWSYDVSSGIPVWSDVMFVVLGQDPGKGVPQYSQHRDFIHPDDWKKFKDAVQGAISGTPYDIEIRVIFPDGSLHYVQTQGFPRRSPDNSITELFGTSQDTTERKLAELASRESNEKYRAFFITSRDCVFISTPEGRWEDFNDAAVELFGYDSREDLLATDITLVYANPADRTAHIRYIREKGYSFEYPVDLQKKDGTIINTIITTVVRKDPSGTIIGFQGSIRDITERKRVEEALRRSEGRLHTLVQTIPDLIWLKDKDGVYLSCNPMFERFFGAREADIVGKTDYDFVNRELADSFRENDRKAMAAGRPTGNEEWITFADDGHRALLDTTKTPMYDSTGTLIGVLGIGRDITEHKRAEEVLRQNQLQLANALDLAHIVNWEFDVADRMFTFDDRFYSFFGTTAEREGGHRISAETYAREFVHPDDISTVAEEIRKILETRDPLYRGQMEHRIIRRGGEIRTIIARYAPVMDAQGRVIRTFGANQDITERKVMEDALLESRQIFADIISFLPDPTFVIDAEGKVLAWNRALEQLSGVPAAEIVGKGDYEYSLWMDGKRRPILINLVQDPDKDYGRVDYRGIIEEGHTIMAETDVIHSGKKITLSLVASPLLDQDGKIIGAIESMRDITRIKETEAELARINAHLETLVKERTHALEEEVIQRRNAEQKVKDTLRHTRNVIEANPDLMVILDAKGILQDVNATTEQMTGLPREKLIGTSYNLYLIANNDAETNFARLLREGALKDIPYDVRHVDGRITPILSNTRVQRDETGAVEYIITAAHDITQQKKDADVIKASLEEKIILLREVHHRVKNNLQIIISLNNLQLRQVNDPQLKQFLNETKNRVRAMSLVHEKLYQSESLSRIDLAEYLRFLAFQLFSYYSTDTRRVKLVVEISKATIDINTAIPIGLIVNELVSNALKYAFPGDRNGTLVISGGLVDQLLTISVKDDGVGMPPGYDWKNATSLGLRLVNILADQIDGTIAVSEDQGTTFIITVREKP